MFVLVSRRAHICVVLATLRWVIPNMEAVWRPDHLRFGMCRHYKQFREKLYIQVLGGKCIHSRSVYVHICHCKTSCPNKNLIFIRLISNYLHLRCGIPHVRFSIFVWFCESFLCAKKYQEEVELHLYLVVIHLNCYVLQYFIRQIVEVDELGNSQLSALKGLKKIDQLAQLNRWDDITKIYNISEANKSVTKMYVCIIIRGLRGRNQNFIKKIAVSCCHQTKWWLGIISLNCNYREH